LFFFKLKLVGLFCLFFPLALIFFIALLAETNRTPFDLPEAESELVAGYNVEYSSITFAMFFLAEYCNMIVMSVIFTLIFFGGWALPNIFLAAHQEFTSEQAVLEHKTMAFYSYVEQSAFLPIVPEIAILVGKVLFFCFLFIFIRSTVPRYRFDQLMDIC